MNSKRSAALLSRTSTPSKPIHIVGLGRFGGNLALIEYLAKQGHQLVLWESSSKESLEQSWNKLLDYHSQIEAHWLTQRPRLPKDDLVFITPAMPFNHPSLLELNSNNLCTEIELSLSLAELHGTILHVVLGSVGKSTCASLLSEALTTKVIGNIGSSFLDELPHPPPELVLEISSFQLHYLQATNWQAHSYLVTPIDDHHSDWHGGLEAYQQAKLNWVKKWRKAKVPGVNIVDLETDPNLFTTQNPNLIGKHNQDNIQLVWALLKRLGRASEEAREALLQFNGLPHRLELCFHNSKLKCYNDSKATSPKASLEALHVFESVNLLILQGPLKELNFQALIEKAEVSCQKIWLVGELVQLFEKFKDKNKVHCFKDLEQAFQSSTLPAEGNVLFSPAAPSYGDYNNYEERGEHFKKLIQINLT